MDVIDFAEFNVDRSRVSVWGKKLMFSLKVKSSFKHWHCRAHGDFIVSYDNTSLLLELIIAYFVKLQLFFLVLISSQGISPC